MTNYEDMKLLVRKYQDKLFRRLKKFLEDPKQPAQSFDEIAALLRILRYLLDICPGQLSSIVSLDLQLMLNFYLYLTQAHFDRRVLATLDQALALLRTMCAEMKTPRFLSEPFTNG